MRSATWVKRFFAHPVPYKPGTHFLYNTPGDVHAVGDRAEGRPGRRCSTTCSRGCSSRWASRRPTWVTSPEGINAGAYGLNVRTEDIAKFGQLYLQKGRVERQAAVPAGVGGRGDARGRRRTARSPTSDWDQGYGYQFWQSRHGYRGDGAFGQYMLVLPQYDAVVAITSGVRDMQSVMNLVWDKLLPAMKPAALPANAVAQRALKAKLAAADDAPVAGRADVAARDARSAGQWYELADNARGIARRVARPDARVAGAARAHDGGRDADAARHRRRGCASGAGSRTGSSGC